MPDEEKDDGLCWLSLDYSTDGKTQEVDYSRRAARLVYLLRYFFAYSYEYCMMYRDALGLLGHRDELTVCSLGCGAQVDRWSLLRALGLDELEGWRAATPVHYHGFEVQDWSREAASLWKNGDDGSAAEEWERGALAFAEAISSGSIKPDIICFPKSAMEIRSCEAVWTSVCDALSKMQVDEFCIALSRSQIYRSVPMFGSSDLGASCTLDEEAAGVCQTMRDIVMELIVAAQAGGFGQVEIKTVDVATHDASDEREGAQDGYRWERISGGRRLTEQMFRGQKDDITSLHSLCPCWKDGEGCTKSDPMPDWHDRLDPAKCAKTDRSPLSIRSRAARGEESAEFRSCYTILHFKRSAGSLLSSGCTGAAGASAGSWYEYDDEDVPFKE